MILFKATIPLEPKTKKNNQKILTNGKTGKPFIVQSDAYKKYERDAGWFLGRCKKTISEPVNVKCIFYRSTERRVDLTNLLEAIDDILVKYRIIADDNFKILAGHDGSRVYIDKEHPRTEIYIEPVSMYNETKEA
jgi:Holliday junction resolvase RusA-like endonuclease